MAEKPEKLKAGKYSKQEIIYIKGNYQTMSDKEIAENLGRDMDSVTRKRTQLGLKKEIGRPPSNKKKLTEEEYLNAVNRSGALADLSLSERKEFAKQIFAGSPDHTRFSRQFTENEMEIFSERYSDYISQWQEILPHEKEQLFNAIVESLLKDRWLEKIKVNEELNSRIRILDNERAGLLLNAQKTDQEIARLEELSELIKEIRNNMEPSEYVMREYHKSSEREETAFKMLKMTRDQRMQDSKEHDINIITLSQQFNDAKERQRKGEEIALLMNEKESKKTSLKEKGFLYGDF